MNQKTTDFKNKTGIFVFEVRAIKGPNDNARDLAASNFLACYIQPGYTQYVGGFADFEIALREGHGQTDRPEYQIQIDKEYRFYAHFKRLGGTGIDGDIKSGPSDRDPVSVTRSGSFNTTFVRFVTFVEYNFQTAMPQF